LRSLWNGISVHDSLEHARRQAAETPWLGSWIAVAVVADDVLARIRWQRTIPQNAGHFTLGEIRMVSYGASNRFVAIEAVTDEHDV
jgi:hypothetical protein